MTEEEAKQLQQAYVDLKEQVKQKDQRIEELEGLLIGSLLHIEELESEHGKRQQCKILHDHDINDSVATD